MDTAALNILILNESANNSEEVISALRRAGIAAYVVRPKNLTDLQQYLANQQWHLALCDGKHDELPCASLKQAIGSANIQLPWHHLCDEITPDAIAHALAEGANDCVSLQYPEHFINALLRDTKYTSLWLKYNALKAQADEFDQRQSQLLDASSDAIAYVSDGIILSCNDSFADYLQSAKEDLNDMPLFDFISKDCRDALKLALKKANGGEVEHVDLSLDNEAGNQLQARLVTTYYEGESAIQISFKAPNSIAGSQPAPASTETQSQNNHLLEKLSAIANTHQGVLLVLEIDKTAQIRSKQGLIAGQQFLKLALEFMANALSEYNAWTTQLADNSLVAHLPQHTLASVRDILPALLKQIEQHMFEFEQRTVQLTCSIGVASLTEELTPEQWLDNAYQAMFEARAENDGNAFKLYTADVRAGVAGNTGMTLDDALSLNRFRMSFQPLVSIKESDKDYYEAYLRMLDQNDEEISPSLFIDAFTQREFNTKLDRWVILECFKQLSIVQKDNPDTKLIINVTANTFNDEKLLPWLNIAIRTANIQPHTLVFQFMIEHVECYLLRAIKVFKQLEQMGCETSINRIGENDESLKIFEKIKPRFAKLAPRFMQALQQDNNPELLRQMLTQLGERGIDGIVGFVESANTMAMLWQMNASLIQGYYIAPPAVDMSHDFADF